MPKPTREPKPPRLFVNRQRFSIAIVQNPIDESDREMLTWGLIHKLPEVIEFKDTVEIRAMLTAMTSGWSDKK